MILKKVIITTGGTGGHIYPALSVAKEIKERNMDVVFVGSNSRMEKKLVPESGIKFIGLDIQAPKNFKSIITYFKALSKAKKLLKQEKPDVVLGFGNYISVPIVLAALLSKIPVYLQEQNVNLGYANKLFYNFAKKTFLAFEKTYEDIPLKNQHKFRVTGNPLRKEIYQISQKLERSKMNLSASDRVLLITGGSLGAKEINDEIIKQFEKFLEDEDIKICWATGKENYEDVVKHTEKYKHNYVIKPYFEDMIHIMSAADLVICRAGALTISELIELEKPSIMIPYGSIKVGQYENAKILSDCEAALVYDRTKIKEAIDEALDLIHNDETLKKMRIRVRSLKKSNSTKAIVNSIGISEE